ncbi:MAG: PAS domain-containing protein [Methyloceanibacter sp.]
MLSGRAFRAQLVMQGQRELFDYWLRSAGERSMPARSDLDPLKVPRLLPNLGLIDLRNGLEQGLFRLAGTRLHEVYGQEITGKRIDEVFAGNCAGYWSRVHSRVVERGSPAHGVVRGPAKGRDHVILFWLRLPLSEDGGRVDRILCHDVAGPGDDNRVTSDVAHFPYTRIQPQPRTQARSVQYG